MTDIDLSHLISSPPFWMITQLCVEDVRDLERKIAVHLEITVEDYGVGCCYATHTDAERVAGLLSTILGRPFSVVSSEATDGR